MGTVFLLVKFGLWAWHQGIFGKRILIAFNGAVLTNTEGFHVPLLFYNQEDPSENLFCLFLLFISLLCASSWGWEHFIKMFAIDQQTLPYPCFHPPNPISQGVSHSIFKSFDNPFFNFSPVERHIIWQKHFRISDKLCCCYCSSNVDVSISAQQSVIWSRHFWAVLRSVFRDKVYH